MRKTTQVPYRLQPVNAVSIGHAPPPCVDCIFWQTREGRTTDKKRWAERVEDEWGAWGTLYFAEDDRLVGFIQFGPSESFPRGRDLPAGPPSEDAVLIACAYLVDLASPWVMQSLFLSVIGEARDRGVRAIETFGYRYPEGTGAHDRFFVHRSIFPADFLADFGFYPVRTEGRVELARLELGGLEPLKEGLRLRAWRRVKGALAPAPVPQRPY
jgi:hypothetical protein